MATNIDLDKIIRSCDTPKAAENAYKIAAGLGDKEQVPIEIAMKLGNGISKKNSGGSSITTSGGGSSSSSGSGSVMSKLSGGANSVIQGVAGIGSNIYQSQMGQSTNTGIPDVAGQTLQSLNENGVRGKFWFDELTLGAKVFTDILKQESELQSEINSKTTITGQLSKDLREDIEGSADYAAKYGMSMSNLGDLYSGLVEQSGKFSLINRETLLSSIPAVKAFGSTMDGLSKTITEFEKVGVGANETIKTISDAGVRSVQLGLSGKKVIEEMSRNVEKLNSYGFQNGIKGLETMVRKSLEFKMSLDNVYAVADKVMNPEGALEMTANLQMLGGAIGDFNDPLKLMYDSTNNVNGLQDALAGAAKGLAVYNSEQGRFEITGANLRRAKDMAGALNVKFEDLTKSAIAGAERVSATTALMASGIKMSDKDKEFMINMSRMKGGVMTIQVPEAISDKLGGKTEIALKDLKEDQKQVLAKYQEDLANMDVKDIAMGQLTELQQIRQLFESKIVKGGVRIAGGVKGATSGLLGDKMNSIKKGLNDDVEDTRMKKFPNDREVYNDEVIKIKSELSNFTNGLKDFFGMKTEKPQPQLSREDMKQAVKDGVYESLSKTWEVNVKNMPPNGFLNAPQSPANFVQQSHSK